MGSRFKILGRTQLRVAAHRFDDQWGQPKLRGMLAALLLRGGRAVPIEELITWVWPEGKEPGNPVSTLDSYAWRIREALRHMEAPPRLSREDGAYQIDVDPREIDFFEFRAAVELARAAGAGGDHESAVRTLTEALALWTDRPLADLHGERAANWRLWAQTELWLPAHDALLHELSTLGRFEEALHRLTDLPAEHQVNLSLMKRRLEALYGLQRFRDATSYHLRMRKHLRANGDHDEADELLRFHNALRASVADHQTGQRDDPATTATNLAANAPHLLRLDIRDFFGRESLLRQLDATTTKPNGEPMAGIVVLDGAAGFGKTALAVHWAHRAASRFTDGVLYEDLGGFADGPKVEPDKVVDTFLAALNIPAERIPTTAGRFAKLRSRLAGRRTLVVLDNALDSSHVLPLLDCLPDCVIIVTSRRKLSGLGRRGAVNVSVPPMSYGECKSWLTRLLGERAANAPGSVDRLAEVCGGNLLALRVVAQHVARAPYVPVNELLDELRDSHTLLSLGDDGDGPDSSVRAVFSWSYHALTTEEQRLFRLVGLHPGPDVTLDLAAALAGQDKQSTKRTLDHLVNAHLLTQPESRHRFRFHDLLRKYAAERIAEEEHRTERDAAAERMLSYYLHSAKNADQIIFPFRLSIPVPPLADDVCPLEFSNSDTAMDWYARERVNINHAIVFAKDFALHEYALRLPGATGEAFQRLGFYEDVISSLQVAIDSARATNAVEEEGDALNNLSYIYLNLRDFKSAELLLRSASEKYLSIGYDVGLAIVVHNQGRLLLERGEFERGIDCYQRSLQKLRHADVDALEVTALYRLGEAFRRQHRFDTAISFCRDGLWLAERIGDEDGQGKCLTELANSLFEQGDLTSASGYCTRALTLQQRQRNSAQAGKTCNLLARIHSLQGDHPSAERHARMALEHCRSARDPREEANAHLILARLFHAQARHDDAAQEKARALAILDDLDSTQAAAARALLDDIREAEPVVPATRTEPLSTKPHVRRTIPRTHVVNEP